MPKFLPSFRALSAFTRLTRQEMCTSSQNSINEIDLSQIYLSTTQTECIENRKKGATSPLTPTISLTRSSPRSPPPPLGCHSVRASVREAACGAGGGA